MIEPKVMVTIVGGSISRIDANTDVEVLVNDIDNNDEGLEEFPLSSCEEEAFYRFCFDQRNRSILNTILSKKEVKLISFRFVLLNIPVEENAKSKLFSFVTYMRLILDGQEVERELKFENYYQAISFLSEICRKAKEDEG